MTTKNASQSAGAAEPNEPRTLHELVERRAVELGERSAMLFPGEDVSFREFAERVRFLARGLAGLGVQPGARVGVLLPPSVDSLAFFFAANRLGAIPVPINARFKGFELHRTIVHSGMHLLVLGSADTAGALGQDYSEMVREILPSLPAESDRELQLAEAPELRWLLCLDDFSAPGMVGSDGFTAAAGRVSEDEVAEIAGEVSADDPAIIIYTSGTTSAPKGALLTHRSLMSVAQEMAQDRMQLTPQDSIWNPLPLFHMGGIGFSYIAMYGGARLCHTGFYNPKSGLDLLDQERCTVALAAFDTIWWPLINQPEFGDRDLSALRLVFALGTPERLGGFAAAVPGTRFLNCYGSTEVASYGASSMPDDSLEQCLSTGGKPLRGITYRIVDPESGESVGPGVVGEIQCWGTNLFREYFRDPEVTEASFVDGWFRTGDLGVIDELGQLTFTGRLKDMLKVGGENVAAGEIEDYLRRHPAVFEAQVVGVRDGYYGQVPAAFVQLRPGHEVTERELIDFCLGQIATFRIPRYVRFVTEYPMSGTKIQKFVLAERIAAELDAAGIEVAERFDSRKKSTL
ncbi:MAG: AMP-dependent synthetase [Hyphomicrobiales bacterium]|nr:MAG: AMP-dependent synthetase [Hyphomicrobiales bacterium]